VPPMPPCLLRLCSGIMLARIWKARSPEQVQVHSLICVLVDQLFADVVSKAVNNSVDVLFQPRDNWRFLPAGLTASNVEHL